MGSEVQEAAVRYTQAGLAVIPLPAGSKNPGRNGWQDLRIVKEDVPCYWDNNQNIGALTGEPSGGVVDVDLDVPEAAKIAGRFLPPTLTSGRAEKPDSHWWYKAPDTKTLKFQDKDEMLIELRSTGCQTIVPPSTHPSGERYKWSKSGLSIAEIEAEELVNRVRELATATLIARHVPPSGRHGFALAVAGFLLRCDRMDEGTALKIMLAAWHAAGADSREAVRDIEGLIVDTAEKLRRDEPVVGGPTLEELAPGIVNLLCKWHGWHRDVQREDEADEGAGRRNQAERLIQYAMDDAEVFFVDQMGTPHALVDRDPVPLTSRCHPWLRRLMWDHEQRAVGGEYLKTAAGTLAARAEFSGEVMELHTRAAWHEDTLYYELRPGRVVKVNAKGWDFVEAPPVLFRRLPNLKPLPDPKRGGDLRRLWAYLNLKTERDRRLLVAYLATVTLPHIPRPILNATGAAGSGKTTLGRVVKRTIDPTAPESVRLDPKDLLQKAAHAFALLLDNQSGLPGWAEDMICRFVTGEADSKRKLYTDDEDIIVELRRAVILNGINVPTDRGDVLDRSLVVELKRIPDKERRTEEEMWGKFDAEHPELLGSLFEVLSQAMARKPSVTLSRRPRLADWGEYVAAVYEVMGWGAERFLEDWDEIVRLQNQATLDSSPVAQAIIKFMEDKDEYTATSSDLHKKLEAVAEKLGVERDKAWPKSAAWLWKRINEVLPQLAAVGIEAYRKEDKSSSQIMLRKFPRSVATTATIGKNRENKPKTDGSKEESAAADAAISEGAVTIRKPRTYAESGSGGSSGNRHGRNSAEPVSFDLRPGESATIADLKERREIASAIRQLFEMHPETRRQPAEQIAVDLYIWTALGYEPSLEVVEAALKEVAP